MTTAIAIVNGRQRFGARVQPPRIRWPGSERSVAASVADTWTDSQFGMRAPAGRGSSSWRRTIQLRLDAFLALYMVVDGLDALSAPPTAGPGSAESVGPR